MLFQSRFHAGLRDGSITQSFRTWSSPRVKVGGRYRFGASHQIEVDRVERLRVGDVSNRQARGAGFDDVEELRSFLSRSSKTRIDARSSVYRVSFHYAGSAPPPPSTGELGRGDEAALRERLARMDRLSRHGPWTQMTLKLIAQHPRTPARDLAKRAGRETQPFKADVRKLKKLGLTLALEVGYDLSPRGRALLARAS